jgi:hypothetical protein
MKQKFLISIKNTWTVEYIYVQFVRKYFFMLLDNDEFQRINKFDTN